METGKVQYAPDYKSKKIGVRISNKTGGAYADPREVIEDELARIRNRQNGVAAEYARLQAAVVEAAKARRRAKLGEVTGSYIQALYAAMLAEHKAVDALIAFEATHTRRNKERVINEHQ